MKSEVEFPPVGTIVSVLIELDKPASTCIHDLARQPMCTIIPLQEKPDPGADGPWILSCWGNGPGIVCFLDDWDGKPFLDAEIIEIKPRSVIGRAMEPEYENDGASDSTSAERSLR